MLTEGQFALRFECALVAFWIILHVLAMFTAFAFTTGVGVYLTAIANTLDVRAIRTAVRIARPLQTSGISILLIGVVLGFAAAGAAGFSLTSKWLIEAYVLVVLLVVVGFGIHQTWIARLAAAAAASPDDHASPEVARVVGESLVRVAGPVSGLLWIALIAVMILKPS